jgi:hypothetical protein
MYHKVSNSKDIDKLVDYLKVNTKPISVYTEKVVKKRSNQSSRFLHGIIFRGVMKHTGYSMNDVKGLFGIMFCTVDELDVNTDSNYLDSLHNLYHLYVWNNVIYVTERTSKMSQQRKDEYIRDIRIWCKDFLDLEFSDPNEEYKDEYQLRFDKLK